MRAAIRHWLLFPITRVSIADALLFFFFLSLDFCCVGRIGRKNGKRSIVPCIPGITEKIIWGGDTTRRSLQSKSDTQRQTDIERVSASVLNCCNSFAHSSAHQTVKHWAQKEIGKTTQTAQKTPYQHEHKLKENNKLIWRWEQKKSCN